MVYIIIVSIARGVSRTMGTKRKEKRRSRGEDFVLPTVHLTHRTVSNRHEEDNINGDTIFQTVILNKEILRTGHPIILAMYFKKY